MIDIDELIKKVDAEIADHTRQLDLWEAIRDHLTDERDNDEIGNHLKYG